MGEEELQAVNVIHFRQLNYIKIYNIEIKREPRLYNNKKYVYNKTLDCVNLKRANYLVTLSSC